MSTISDRVDPSTLIPRLGASAARRIARSGVVVSLGAAILLFSVLRPEVFFTWHNATTILANASLVAIVAMGITLPLALHEFDLAAAALIGFTSAVVASLISDHGVPWPVAILLALGVGAALGTANGAVIAIFPGSSLIVTLGMASVIHGLENWLSGGQAIFSGIPRAFLNIGRSEVAFGIRTPVLIMIGTAIVLWFVLSHTVVGRETAAIGGNRSAAVAAGIPVGRRVLLAFVASGVLASLGGVLFTAQAGAFFPAEGQTYLLSVFTAAFLGSALTPVGHVSILASALGAIYLTLITTGLSIVNVSPWVSTLVQGAILIFAVVLSRLSTGHTQESAFPT